MKLIAVVFTQAEGEERFAIGNVQIDQKQLAKLDGDPGSDLDRLLKEYWDEWKEEVPEPDADSEFIDWLVENKKGFSHPKVEVTYAVIDV